MSAVRMAGTIWGIVARIDRPTLVELAARADERAARARRHAADARDEAREAADQGNSRAEQLRLKEADAHEAAARATEQTAALYRNRIRHLSRVT